MSNSSPSKLRRYLLPERVISGNKRQLIEAIGGAGRSIANYLPRSYASNVLYLDTDLRYTEPPTLLIGITACKGLPARTQERSIHAAIESLDEIGSSLMGVDSLILVAGLGGGMSGAARPYLT